MLTYVKCSSVARAGRRQGAQVVKAAGDAGVAAEVERPDGGQLCANSQYSSRALRYSGPGGSRRVPMRVIGATFA